MNSVLSRSEVRQAECRPLALLWIDGSIKAGFPSPALDFDCRPVDLATVLIRHPHQSAILLLDEPGLSLHPLAQRDLAEFFNGLATTNQIVFTTHSPFLVDADRLDRVRKVYVDEDGTTRASPDLRKSSAKNAQAGAAYAVYSALNLNVSESLLLGCQPVVVEGPSDQHYLTAIKVLLISQRLIAPTRELVFPPGGGTKTLRITASILTGRDDELPFTLLDGDAMGMRMIKELSTSLYSADNRKLLCTDNYVGFTDRRSRTCCRHRSWLMP